MGPSKRRRSPRKPDGPPGYFHLRLDGLNTVEAYFYKYSFPEQFGKIAQEDINLYGPMIARYYEFYDQLIGKYLTSLKDKELLVVYSPYGIDPLPALEEVRRMDPRRPDVSAYHEDGARRRHVLLRERDREAEDRRGDQDRGHRADAPLLSRAAGGAGHGRDRPEPVFVGDFTAENPIISISSYEEIRFRKPGE